MKKITEDLQITDIDISIARLGATITFLFLEQYEAKAWYLRRSSGNQWLETGDEVNTHTHDAITAEVEENEEEIISWVEEQFAKETDRMDPEVETYDILQLQKMNFDAVMRIAQGLKIPLVGLTKEGVRYAILEKQAKS